jgi:hypothetical protein
MSFCKLEVRRHLPKTNIQLTKFCLSATLWRPVLFIIGAKVELSWLIKLRIAAVIAVGVFLLGILAWPIAAPLDPFGAVRANNLNFAGAITLVLLALLMGLLAYFISWPYGQYIGVLAVPCGLAVWAMRSGSLAQLIRLNPALQDRQLLFTSLKWESFFWLLLVFVGFAGVFLAQKILTKPEAAQAPHEASSKQNKYLNVIIALVGSVVIGQFCIGIFAQGINIVDHRFNSVVVQPAVGQIFFAVSISLGLAAFVVKRFLNINYIWPTIAGALITTFTISIYAKQDTLQYFAERYPATFFSHAVISILPVQMVAFGTLGAIVGFWLAVRYDYHRKHST